MSKYRARLPQLADRLFLSDGGIETTLIYQDGLDLPYFAAFHLFRSEGGEEALRRYYERFLSIATAARTGFILESPTWRANRDWGEKLGYSEEELSAVNRRSIDLLADLRRRYEQPDAPIVISGCIGPRGDGYDPGKMMNAEEAAAYHAAQIATFALTEADMVTAITMNYVAEAIGIALGAARAMIPVAISFTVETNGRLPTGESIGDAIAMVDAATGRAPVYYMINCAHPTHFEDALRTGEPWLNRVRGIRANASTKSHAELDQATELDAGDPVDLGRRYAELRGRMRKLTILGGCCGTDHRHIEQISLACAEVA